MTYKEISEYPLFGPYYLGLYTLEDRDVDKITAAMNDQRVTSTLGGPPFNPYLREHGVAFAKIAVNSIYRNKYHKIWAIRDQTKNGELIGSIDIRPSDDDASYLTIPQKFVAEPEDRYASFGFWLSPEYRRQGITSAALKVLIYELGVKEFGIRKFTGDCFTGNFASRRTFEKLGFMFEREGKNATKKLNTGEFKDTWYMKMEL